MRRSWQLLHRRRQDEGTNKIKHIYGRFECQSWIRCWSKWSGNQESTRPTFNWFLTKKWSCDPYHMILTTKKISREISSGSCRKRCHEANVTNKWFHNGILIIKTYPGCGINSYYNLVVTTLRIKVKKLELQSKQKIDWRSAKQKKNKIYGDTIDLQLESIVNAPTEEKTTKENTENM